MAMKADLVTQLRLAGLPEPVPEHPFHPARKWRFDLAWPGLMLAVEYEGVVYGGAGRHQRARGLADDCEKYAEALLLGWRVLRVTHRQVDSGMAVEWVRRAMGAGAEAS